MQQRMRRAVAELNIGYRHSPIVAEHHRLLPGLHGAHASVHGWHDFGAGPRAGDRAVDARLMLHPGREPVRFFQRLRGTTHHLVLFAGALATAETHQRLQALADAIVHAHPDRIESHLIVPHELPEDLAVKGEILLDPRGELHHRYGARSACLYVVRPDGYIGFRSQPPDAEALKLVLHPDISLEETGGDHENPCRPRCRHEHARQGAGRDLRADDAAGVRYENPCLCRRARGGDRDLPFQHRRRGDQPPLRGARRGHRGRDHQPVRILARLPGAGRRHRQCRLPHDRGPHLQSGAARQRLRSDEHLSRQRYRLRHRGLRARLARSQGPGQGPAARRGSRATAAARARPRACRARRTARSAARRRSRCPRAGAGGRAPQPCRRPGSPWRVRSADAPADRAADR